MSVFHPAPLVFPSLFGCLHPVSPHFAVRGVLTSPIHNACVVSLLNRSFPGDTIYFSPPFVFFIGCSRPCCSSFFPPPPRPRGYYLTSFAKSVVRRAVFPRPRMLSSFRSCPTRPQPVRLFRTRLLPRWDSPCIERPFYERQIDWCWPPRPFSNFCKFFSPTPTFLFAPSRESVFFKNLSVTFGYF